MLFTVRDIHDVTLKIVLFLKCSSMSFFERVMELELHKTDDKVTFQQVELLWNFVVIVIAFI